MPRLTRDEIISQGLDLASCATVTAHDMPQGVLDGNAYAIRWLQNALDFYHRRVPFSADVASVALTIQSSNTDVLLTSTQTAVLPSDYIVDVRNGVIAPGSSGSVQQIRLRRVGFQRWLSLSLQTITISSFTGSGVYTIAQNPRRIKIWPPVTASNAATLWYYALPPVLADTDIPNFPDDWVLVEFIRLKALEWVRSVDPGTAQAYLGKQLAGFRASGLLNEAEYDTIPLENNQAVIDGYPAPWDWMGTPAGST